MSLKDKILKLLPGEKEDDLETIIQGLASYSAKELKNVDTRELFGKYKLKKIGEGLNSRTFKVGDLPWVIKESRWDLSLEIFGETKLPVPKTLLNLFLRTFTFKNILPKPDRVKEEYAEYLEFAQYFGYFETEESYHHPNRELLFQSQKNIRKSLLFFRPEVEKKFKIKLPDSIETVFKDEKTVTHNFLPKEYLLYGKSFSKENLGKYTQIVFQEFTEGKPMYECKPDELTREQQWQIILMLYLILLMDLQVQLIPDTRSRNALHPINWVTKTDNIFIGKDGLKYIDTRWMWDTSSNLVRRGLLIPEVAINQTKGSLVSFLKKYV